MTEISQKTVASWPYQKGINSNIPRYLTTFEATKLCIQCGSHGLFNLR